MDIDAFRLTAAYNVARQTLLDQRDPAGHWVGRLASSALSTATAVSALAVVNRYGKTDTSGRFADEPAEARLNELIVRGLGYLADTQNADGGWGDTDLSLSNIATTMLVKAAFRLTGMPANDEDLLDRADAYIDAQGGIPGLRRRYGRDKTFAVPILTNCALAGVVPWREVSALPFELAALPQHWFRFLRLPVVSYAIPALVAIGQAKFHYDPPWNPLVRWVRRAALDKSLRVLQQMQPQSGGFLEATPLTSFVVMSLASIGHADHPVVRRGVEFLIDSAREDGSWAIDTNLATWNTTLSINALASGESFDVGCSMLDVGRATQRTSKRRENRAAERPTSNVQRPTSNVEFAGPTQDTRPLGETGLLDWLLHCQVLQTHPYTGAAPGGWAWTDLSGGVPDADDTSGALLALSQLCKPGAPNEEREERIVEAAAAGVSWLLGLQNSDGGWPTFCRGWGTMPFDRSAADLTAHALRALYAWRPLITSHSERSEESHAAAETLRFAQGDKSAQGDAKAQCDKIAGVSLAARIDEAIHRGFVFLRRSQHAGGSWTPLWFGNQYLPQEENPVYGTARVLLAYRDLGRLDTPEACRGLQWLAAHQNLDGGWGGAALAGYGSPRRAGNFSAAPALGTLANGLPIRDARAKHDRGPDGPADGLTSSRPAMRLHRPDHVTQNAQRSMASAPVGDEGQRIKAAGRVIDHPQSTVEETALAVEALCGAADVPSDDGVSDDPSLAKARADGLAWLVQAVESKHWTECSPLGLYFAKLWYYEKLYPLIFTVSALGTAVGHAAQRTARQPGRTSGRTVPPELAHPHPVSLTR